MARLIRIEYASALYHITSRGTEMMLAVFRGLSLTIINTDEH